MPLLKFVNVSKIDPLKYHVDYSFIMCRTLYVCAIFSRQWFCYGSEMALLSHTQQICFVCICQCTQKKRRCCWFWWFWQHDDDIDNSDDDDNELVLAGLLTEIPQLFISLEGATMSCDQDLRFSWNMLQYLMRNNYFLFEMRRWNLNECQYVENYILLLFFVLSLGIRKILSWILIFWYVFLLNSSMSQSFKLQTALLICPSANCRPWFLHYTPIHFHWNIWRMENTEIRTVKPVWIRCFYPSNSYNAVEDKPKNEILPESLKRDKINTWCWGKYIHIMDKYAWGPYHQSASCIPEDLLQA